MYIFQKWTPEVVCSKNCWIQSILGKKRINFLHFINLLITENQKINFLKYVVNKNSEVFDSARSEYIEVGQLVIYTT